MVLPFFVETASQTHSVRCLPCCHCQNLFADRWPTSVLVDVAPNLRKQPPLQHVSKAIPKSMQTGYKNPLCEIDSSLCFGCFCWDRFPNPFCETGCACLFNSGPSALLVQTCLQSNLFKIYRCFHAVSCSPQSCPDSSRFSYVVELIPKSMRIPKNGSMK